MLPSLDLTWRGLGAKATLDETSDDNHCRPTGLRQRARICSCFVQNVHLINRFGFCIALLSANQRPLANEGHFISLAERRIVHVRVRPVATVRPPVLFGRLHSSSASKHFSFPLKGTSPKPPPLFPSLPSLETCWSAPRNRMLHVVTSYGYVCKRSARCLGSAAPDPTHPVSTNVINAPHVKLLRSGSEWGWVE